MGLLPEEIFRVVPLSSFMHIGKDSAAWTLYVKDSSGITKAYACIFMCASSQMVHLELTKILTTDEFLQAFNRVVSRRGVCGTVWSDYAKAFKAESREIKRLYDRSQTVRDIVDEKLISSESTSKGIKWQFIMVLRAMERWLVGTVFVAQSKIHNVRSWEEHFSPHHWIENAVYQNKSCH